MIAIVSFFLRHPDEKVTPKMAIIAKKNILLKVVFMVKSI